MSRSIWIVLCAHPNPLTLDFVCLCMRVRELLQLIIMTAQKWLIDLLPAPWSLPMGLIHKYTLVPHKRATSCAFVNGSAVQLDPLEKEKRQHARCRRKQWKQFAAATIEVSLSQTKVRALSRCKYIAFNANVEQKNKKKFTIQLWKTLAPRFLFADCTFDKRAASCSSAPTDPNLKHPNGETHRNCCANALKSINLFTCVKITHTNTHTQIH